MKILLLITHIAPNPQDLCSSSEQYIFDVIRELSDGKDPNMAQKRSKDIDKIVHVTSRIQP